MKIIVDVRHQDKDYMPFLQTIRFVLSVLVIFGHVKGFDKITPLLNPDSYEKVPISNLCSIITILFNFRKLKHGSIYFSHKEKS